MVTSIQTLKFGRPGSHGETLSCFEVVPDVSSATGRNTYIVVQSLNLWKHSCVARSACLASPSGTTSRRLSPSGYSWKDTHTILPAKTRGRIVCPFPPAPLWGVGTRFRRDASNPNKGQPGSIPTAIRLTTKMTGRHAPASTVESIFGSEPRKAGTSVQYPEPP